MRRECLLIFRFTFTPPRPPRPPGLYEKIVNSAEKTSKGLFNLYTVQGKIFCEIPGKLLDKEMVLVSWAVKVPGSLEFPGELTQNRAIKWQKSKQNLLLRHVGDIIKDITADPDDIPFDQAIRAANFTPILDMFPIAAEKKNGKDASYIIDITQLFTTDKPYIGFDQKVRQQYKLRYFDPRKSFIISCRSFPGNIQVRNVATYVTMNGSQDTLSMEMCHRLYLLPEKPMKPRLYDKRVGYHGIYVKDFHRGGQPPSYWAYIRKWRLEPKDKKAYAEGKPVEPVHPIVFYIDPATPQKWRPYIKKGVENWNNAFAAAGFKHAVTAKDGPPPEMTETGAAPGEDRYVVIHYCASNEENSLHYCVTDPRTGEILASDILWSHNMLNRLSKWYIVQTAAANPRARKIPLEDRVMGELITFMISHEVGHSLGLSHNMRASAAFPVESLRSASFTRDKGITASVMDYARFNYVAQPGDKGVCFIPKISDYDIFAIQYGYRVWADAGTPQEEKPLLQQWLKGKADNCGYFYCEESFVDPSAQQEDIGDNAVKAGKYGIANLERVVKNLIAWTCREGDDYSRLQTLYYDVFRQWHYLVTHAAKNIGGVWERFKPFGLEEPVYRFVPRSRQKETVKFLCQYAFKTPYWLINEDILRLIQHSGVVERIRIYQVNFIKFLLNPGTMQRLIEAEARHGRRAYTLLELMRELRLALWDELKNGDVIDTYRRNLQRGYLEQLKCIMTEEMNPIPEEYRHLATEVNVAQSDLRPVIRAQLKTLKKDIIQCLNKKSKKMTITRIHLEDALVRIKHLLELK